MLLILDREGKRKKLKVTSIEKVKMSSINWWGMPKAPARESKYDKLYDKIDKLKMDSALRVRFNTEMPTGHLPSLLNIRMKKQKSKFRCMTRVLSKSKKVYAIAKVAK